MDLDLDLNSPNCLSNLRKQLEIHETQIAELKRGLEKAEFQIETQRLELLMVQFYVDIFRTEISLSPLPHDQLQPNPREGSRSPVARPLARVQRPDLLQMLGRNPPEEGTGPSKFRHPRQSEVH
ncbi:uncharacterized protein LOC108048681 [Drosophila rhopaloa]|uniref:Uncharacterized protein LOC108048681 n=1 Tax=Drosophila rhopaloa TaxID=1041015 RepID=A0A6P4FI34_DRORH|nr:uncharacterized protein LOC108048681 [Drosophila rhopaloa]